MAHIKLTDLPKRDNALLIWQKINKKNGKDNNFELFPTTTPPTEVRLKFNPDVKGIDKLFKTQDIEDILDNYEIDKKYYKLIDVLMMDIRDEEDGMKPRGHSDGSRKELMKVLKKAIKEGKLNEGPKVKKGDIKKGKFVWFEDGKNSAVKVKVKNIVLSKDGKEEHYVTNKGTFTPDDVVGY